MISCDGWPDYNQERKALKPHCMNMMTNWDVWHVITGRMICFMTRPRWRYHELGSQSVQVWVYRPSKTTIKRWHCSSNEKNKLKQRSTVNIQNTEDDLKILLTILSIKYLHNYFYYAYPSSWLCFICLDTGWHNSGTHCNKLSNILATFFSVWKSTDWKSARHRSGAAATNVRVFGLRWRNSWIWSHVVYHNLSFCAVAKILTRIIMYWLIENNSA